MIDVLSNFRDRLERARSELLRPFVRAKNSASRLLALRDGQALASVGDLYAAPRRVNDPVICDFYHVMDIPGYGITTSCEWDLRGREAAYLGGVDFAGKRVL